MANGHGMGAAVTSYVAVIAVIAAIVLAGTWGMGFWGRGAPETITIGNTAFMPAALVHIADERGYFAENGLDVVLGNESTGQAAITRVENGEEDLSLSAEYTVVQESFRHANISVIGCVDRFETMDLIVRTDRGIATVPDVAGKRIGLTRKSQAEFYLGRFLDLRGMSVSQVTLVDLPPSQYVAALANGSVDGVVAGTIHLGPIRERLGASVLAWRVQSDMPAYNVLAGRNDWIAAHPKAVAGLLTALSRAEEYAVAHPDEAKAIVGCRLNYTDAATEEVWPLHQFALSLDRSLLTAMNDEARWMIANNLTTATTPPDLRDYVDTTALARVDPGAVTIL